VKDPAPLPTPIARYLASFMRVVPRYRDLFGQSATFNQLMEIVRSYPVFAWLSFLSRLQTLLGPPRETDIERHRAAFAGLIGPNVRKRLVDFENSHPLHGSCLTFVEPQIAALQQLAILYAPQKAESDFVTEHDFDQLATALLIVWELMHLEPRPKDPEGVGSALAQAVLRNSFEATPALACRAYHAYGIGDTTLSEAAAALHTHFKTAAGVSLADYILGGLTLLLLEETQSPAEIAAGWTPRAPAGPQKDPLIGDSVEAFCTVRCAPLDRLRAEAQRRDGDRPVHEFSLIALSRFPVVEFPEQGRFILSVARIATALFEGVRHAIQTVRLEGDNRVPSIAETGKIFGSVFEEYVQRILADAFGDRLTPLPRSQTAKRADGIVEYPDRLIVYEIKSKHAPVVGRLGPRTTEERMREIECLGVPEAAEQLAATISELRRGDLNELLGRQYDWTSTPIIPVIITADTVPLVWNMWAQLQGLTRPISELPMQDQIARVRFLDIEDAERLPELVQVTDVARLFLEWANHEETFERPLLRHLNVAEIQYGNAYLRRRYEPVMRRLADRHGLDATKLDFSHDGAS